MGRLTEYLGNGAFSRARSARTEISGDFELSGFTENLENLGRIMTNDPDMAKIVQKIIRKLLKEARNKISKDARDYIEYDPRKAARAVKFMVYKQLFGGNVSILQKRAGSAGDKYILKRHRKLDEDPKQWGGNRRQRVNDNRNRLDEYFGADRGFVLRFLNGGTKQRLSRYGNRGAVRATDWFGHIAPWHIDTAAQELADSINEYVKHLMNG